MEFEEAFQALDAAVVAKKQRHLKDIEVAILRGSWQKQKYHEIAQAQGYTTEYLKQDVGPKLWKLLSEILGEKVSKTNFRAALARQSLFGHRSITKDYLAEISKQYSYSFRFVDGQSERSLVNIVVSAEQITALSGLEIIVAADGIFLNAKTPISGNQYQDYR